MQKDSAQALPFSRFTRRSNMLKINQTKTDLKRIAHFAHGFFIQMGDFVGEPLFVDRPNLLQKNDRIAIKAMRCRVDLHMRGQLCLLNLGGDGCHDHGRTEPVADIILNDQHWSDATLLGTDYG